MFFFLLFFNIIAIGNKTSPPSESPSSVGSPQNSHVSNSNGSVVSDFNAELTKHLTLKKQKKQQQEQQQQQQGTNSSGECSSRINRGPPPQPPSKSFSRTVTDNNSSSITKYVSELNTEQFRPKHLTFSLILNNLI